MTDAAYTFSIKHRGFLDEQGAVIEPLPAWADDIDRVLAAYRTMVMTRTFDRKAIALQRTGKLGTYPSVLGHEAIGTAIGQCLGGDDVFVPYYRDQAAQFLRGVTLVEQLLYWGGDERGSHFQHCPQDLPVAVPIATQCCHAAGIASAMRIRGEKRAVVCSLGDGASSKGDFLESINLAGAWHLPVVFVVANNQWAISTPRSLQCGAETLAQKAIGAGLPGLVVDGNDYFAISDALIEGLERAHQGKGAMVIEALTYRLGDHTTADDATRYRSAEALKAAWDREPVKRLQQYLFEQGFWNPDKEQALQEEMKQRVDEAVETYLATPPEPPEAMLQYLFAEVPKPLQGQFEKLRARGGEVRDA
ncbi:pyruvate dehydrogenase (acetyl-transferring) E1 component subunit alpha [Marinobacteraceae bacterium S3BR75-40.1]